MTEELLFQAFIYLLAAVATVPIAKQLGLGSVLGYLLAGVIIGPHLLGLVGQGEGGVMHVAEFGVVMMLFLVGLELRPNLLWRLRGPIIGTGGAQVIVTTLVVAGLAAALGLKIKPALAIGMIFSASSTAIALQTLTEKGLLKSKGGQTSFSVLLFQDLAVIPILAILPLLAVSGAVSSSAQQGDGAPWQRALLVVGVVAAIVGGGRFLIRPVFRYLARTKLHEIFTAAALLLVVGIALAMEKVGLSPALGTFLAGVVLAESEYRHELESDIEPFKGLLLGLFFISVGSSIDLPLVKSQPVMILGLVLGLIIVKFLLLFGIGKITNLEKSQNFTFAFALAQGGEFAFVLISFAAQNQVIDQRIGNVLVATVALSMVASPFLFSINDRFVQPMFSSQLPDREADEIDEKGNPVILAGFGRFGHIVGRVLNLQGVKTTVLDLDADQVDLVRKLGVKVFYGDASRLELLKAAGAESAKLLIIAIDDEEKSMEMVEMAQKHFPNLQILARAAGRDHAYRLLKNGVKHIYRETLGSSLDLSVNALRLLGFRAYEAQRAAKAFRDYDEQTVRELAQYSEDETQLIARAKE
ncbi:MAG: glutathione-regulated potassium-efflux system ancillary protein KefC, partial [Verrucomicrobiota bacterium]|nr:glutathione-regulated potassium-efflux system ancillary protein KefC [Verrucomicrobiota bacterium]